MYSSNAVCDSDFSEGKPASFCLTNDFGACYLSVDIGVEIVTTVITEGGIWISKHAGAREEVTRTTHGRHLIYTSQI